MDILQRGCSPAPQAYLQPQADSLLCPRGLSDCWQQTPHPQWDPLGSAEEGHVLPGFLTAKDPTHLGVEGSQAQAANWSEEERGHCNLDEESGHHAELVQPDGQMVGKPGGGRGQALSLEVVGEGCG